MIEVENHQATATTALAEFKHYICTETQAISLEFKDKIEEAVEVDMDEFVLKVKLRKKWFNFAIRSKNKSDHYKLAFMNVDAQKLEIIEWVSRLKNGQIIREILKLREKEIEQTEKHPVRKFGSGKHIFTYIADDFNEPLEDFKEYME